MATLAPSQAAEALLSRARRLSSHAYERSCTATPATFAEGEDVVVVPPSPRSPSSPAFAPIATLSTASLHQLHRNSFNELLRDHGRRRSSYQKGSSTINGNSPPSTEHSLLNTTIIPSGTTTADQRQDGKEKQHDTTEPSSPGEYPSSNFHHTTNNHKNGSCASASDDAQAEGRSACPTNHRPTMTRHSLTIVTHPSALALESIRERREGKSKHANNIGSHYVSSGGDPSDHGPYYADGLVHRKHRSENGAGGKFVFGILEALRDGDQDPSAGVPAPSGSSASPRTLTPATGALASQEPPSITQRTRADFRAEARPVSFAESLQKNRANASVPCATPLADMQDAYIPVSTAATAKPPHAPTAAAIIASPTMARPSARRDPNAPPPPPKSPVDRESWIRRGSHTGSVYSDISSIADNASILSSPTLTFATTITTTTTTANTANTAKGSSTRSSKLFGRFVPKFLHSSSSSGPSTTADNSSLRSANSPSLTALSTTATARSGRSASFGGPSSPIVASGYNAMAKKTGPLPAIPDALTSLPDIPDSALEFSENWWAESIPSSSPPTTAATAAVSVESDNGIAHPKMLERITSFSSRTSRRSILSVRSTRSGYSEDVKPFEESESIFPIVEEQKPISIYNIEAQYEKEEEERWPTARDYKVEIQYEEEAEKDEFEQGQDEEEEKEQGSDHILSPYIIDESCDDDFFLNSVLRKKSKPLPLSLVSTPTGAGARLGAGGWPSSAGRTPSLTNSIFTSSSQTSSATPSPTTPMFASSHSQNHGSSAPTMIHAGLDKKRTRLSDAVKEWRRSANISSGYADSLTQPSFAV